MTPYLAARRQQSPGGTLQPAGAVVVLTATARLSRHLAERHDAEQVALGRSGWIRPQILPFDAWLTRVWKAWLYSGVRFQPIQLLEPAAEHVLWCEILRTSSAGREMFEVERAAELAQAAWRLACLWELPLNAPEWGDTEDTEAFRDWMTAFEGRCRENSWLSGARLPGCVSDLVTLSAVDVPEELLVVGFDELPPVYRRLLDGLRRRGVAVQVRDGWWGGPARDSGFDAVRIGLPDARSEVRAAATWARHMALDLADHPNIGNDPGRIGVVVPDLEVRRDEIERVFRNAFHPGDGLCPERDHTRAFNISLGPPLADYPLIETALDVLRADPDSIPLEDAARWLCSPFLGRSAAEFTARSLLVGSLRRLREPCLSVETILALASDAAADSDCSGLCRCLRNWRDVHSGIPARLSPSDWPRALSELLGAIGWPGEGPLASAEHQTMEAWREALSRLAGLDHVLGPVDLRSVVSVLDRIARSVRFQPESEPAPVQILGLFEAGGLEFDCLWIMGMDSNRWPRSAGPNPFLPLRLQRRHELPDSSPERHLAFARQLTERLLASVPDTARERAGPSVVVSYPKTESDAVLMPSPLFAALEEISFAALRLTPSVGFAEGIRLSANLERIRDARAPRWTGNSGRPVPGGTGVLADQAACPFRAFARARLGARPGDVIRSGLDPRDRGILIHDVMARVWSELGSHRQLMSMGSGNVDQIVDVAVDGAIVSMARHRSVLRGVGFAAIEGKRLRNLVLGWLEIEKKRSPFVVVAREARTSMSLADLPLVVRSDRVDELEDGTRVVIDYKTRVSSSAVWEGSRPNDPQLPTYASHLQSEGHPLAAVLFAVLRKGSESFRGAAVSDDIVPGVRPCPEPLEAMIERWKAALERLAEDFREGHAEVDPRDGSATCRNCGLDSLCRVAEQASWRAGPTLPTSRAAEAS